MVFSKFLTMAYRDLRRNSRRSALTALAVALGLVVTFAFSSLIEGMVESILSDSILITTGHIQIRNVAYDEDKGSLLAQDLLDDPEAWTEQFLSLPEVRSAAPVLWSSGLISTAQESIGVQIVGLNPDDGFHEPIRTGIVDGQYLQNDERGTILIGRVLARQLEVGVGDRVSLAASTASGQGQEGVFTISGLIDTGFPSIDQNRVIMPLAQAQTFSDVGNRFSSLIIMLDNQDDAQQVAARIQIPGTEVFTWRDLNTLILESVENGLIFYYILYGIVFIAVGVLIANTLLMSVFARAREIGILAALGMNGRQIMLLFLLEGVLLAIFGIGVGWVLGLAVVSYMTFVGFTIPEETVTLVEGFAFGTTLKGGFAPQQFIVLSILLLIVVSVVTLYPAWFASRMEPVEALHSI